MERWRRRYCGPLLRRCGGHDLLTFESEVDGRRPDRRRDVARARLVPDRLGFLDLEPTGGPTGYAGAGLDAALRGFQRAHDLAVDGWMPPTGRRIGRWVAGCVTWLSPPSPRRSVEPWPD